MSSQLVSDRLTDRKVLPKMVETTTSKALNVGVNVRWLSNWTPRQVTTDDTRMWTASNTIDWDWILASWCWWQGCHVLLNRCNESRTRQPVWCSTWFTLCDLPCAASPAADAMQPARPRAQRTSPWKSPSVCPWYSTISTWMYWYWVHPPSVGPADSTY